jgi:hypothetical protein
VVGRREEILERRRKACLHASAIDGGAGGGDPTSGGSDAGGGDPLRAAVPLEATTTKFESMTCWLGDDQGGHTWDVACCLDRRISSANLGLGWVVADNTVKMRWVIRLGFFNPRSQMD